MHLILFDIDGTLIQTGGAGIASLWQSFLTEFGHAKPDREFDFSGWTDRGIVSNLFKVHKIEDSSENWQRFLRGYLSHLPEYLASYQGTALPGIHSLLKHLKSRSDVLLGLLTGNVRQGAALKLKYYQLESYFDFGGFGDFHPDRNDIAKEAVQVARDHLSEKVEIKQTWVIGDTPRDISCARAIQANAIAVATGSFSREDLGKSAPDFLFENFSNPEAVLDLLN